MKKVFPMDVVGRIGTKYADKPAVWSERHDNSLGQTGKGLHLAVRAQDLRGNHRVLVLEIALQKRYQELRRPMRPHSLGSYPAEVPASTPLTFASMISGMRGRPLAATEGDRLGEKTMMGSVSHLQHDSVGRGRRWGSNG
jgi:hypothetical protein